MESDPTSKPAIKGDRASNWIKRALLFVGVFFLCIPVSWMVAMLMTPVLWKLEPVLHMELAGHSGPSDWVIYVIHGIVVVGVFLVAVKIFRQPARQG